MDRDGGIQAASLHSPAPASVLGGPYAVQQGTMDTCSLRVRQQALLTFLLRTPSGTYLGDQGPCISILR